jgi:hypothetical protein
MPRRLPQPHPDPPFGDRLDGFIGRVREALVGGNGQTLPGTPEATPHRPCIGVLARPAEAQRLLSATIDENSQLTAEVRRLELEF